ncbi:MAG: DUF1264 domain-containing protein [Cyanobacteria bacterium SZAS LIN-3]|nr:DUF1264 domain-containing protein [Cyanobacteria bacterium SZAS LIN-3]MBS2008821.1 DUF1264 domain-containing protein [Cyanobacteria bacterium SZAS TMP-1]
MKSILSVVALGALCLSLSAPSTLAMDGQDLSKVPPRTVEMYLDGFHNYKSDLKLPANKQLQLRVGHFCVHNSPTLIQCMLFDTNGSVEGKHPRLVGVEYVITNEVYQGLSKAEKAYWHPHDGEVSSGMLILPGMPKEDQEKTLKFVSTTWGKTWHSWNPERKLEKDGSSKVVWPELPSGPAQLMWSVRPEDATDETKKIVKERATNPAF